MRVVSVSNLFYKNNSVPCRAILKIGNPEKGGFVNVILVKEVEVILIEPWDDRIVHS